MQTFLAHVARLPFDDRMALRAALGEDVFAQVEQAGALGWLPVGVNRTCTRVVSEHLGASRAHDWFQSLMLSTFQTPLLKGLVNAVVRVSGRDPAKYVSWVSKGFELMYRNCGRWEVEETASGTAVLAVEGLPEELRTDRLWLQSVASALSALFEIAKVDGAVMLRAGSSGRAEFRLRWVPADA